MSTTAIPTGESEVRPEAVAKTATAAKIFKYSAFVHLGDGAPECAVAVWVETPPQERTEPIPTCEDPSHFHAWCRLPNRYQEDDIRGKAQAAKARRVRALKDPESDLAVVLDSELGPLNDTRFLETLIEELVGEDLAEDYFEAQGDMREEEQFKHVDQDREEHDRLSATERDLAEAEQSEEYKRLGEHLRVYLEAINTRLKEIQEPKRIELRQRQFESVFEAVRSRRIDQDATQAFLDTYNAWSCYIGTFEPELHPVLRKPFKPKWAEIGHRDRPEAGTMFGEDPLVIRELGEIYTELRQAFRQGSLGN